MMAGDVTKELPVLPSRSIMKKILLAFAMQFVCIIASAQVTIIMENDGGVYKVPCTVNGVKMKFVFDTGASTVCISKAVAIFLLDNDYISKSDVKGSAKSMVADGSIVDNVIINLRDVEVGGIHIKNVDALVSSSISAPLLLGQSAIKKLGKITIQGNKLTLNSASVTGGNVVNQDNSDKLNTYEKKHNDEFDCGDDYTVSRKSLVHLIKYNASNYVNSKGWKRKEIDKFYEVLDYVIDGILKGTINRDYKGALIDHKGNLHNSEKGFDAGGEVATFVTKVIDVIPASE